MTSHAKALSVKDVRALFSRRSLWQAWLDVEATLAEVEAELGVIPSSHPRNPRRHINDEQVLQTLAQLLTRVGIQARIEAAPMSAFLGQARKPGTLAMQDLAFIPLHHQVVSWAIRANLDYVPRTCEFTFAHHFTPRNR
jgi:hypothetical protein